MNPKLHAASRVPNSNGLIRKPRPEPQPVNAKAPLNTKGPPRSTSPAPSQFADLPMPAGGVHKFGVFTFNVYSFSGYANDLTLHLLGGKAYLSWVFGALLPVAWLASGAPFRGLKTKIGKFWLAIAVLLVVSAPFSIWRSESLSLLQTYLPRALFIFFYITSFTLNLKLCRSLFLGGVCCNTAILVAAGLFGRGDEVERFAIPNSLFFGGANDLALALVSGLGFTLYLTLQKSIFAQILGAVEFLATLFFMLKTGSRGGFLALGALLVTWAIFSKQRMKLFALVVPAIALVPFLPGSAMTRLISIKMPGSLGAPSASMSEDEASQAERTMLLQRALIYAVTHPALGLGPGTFMQQLFYDDISSRTHTHALGTHNTYMQLASECGFPVVILYISLLVMSVKLMLKVMKRTGRAPPAAPVYNMALCTVCNLIAFAVSSGFNHVAYGQTAPMLTAMAVCIGMASREGDLQWIAAETAAGNA